MNIETYTKLIKRLDKSLKTGKIGKVEWRDARWKLLQAMKPAITVRVTGI